MIYLDNAATGGFKIGSVIDAVNTAIRYVCANPGRSGHRLSITGAKAIYECRNVLGKLFSCEPERVIFTKNCTEALNTAIFGSLKVGGKVICTTFEHNSVLRPLYHLAKEKKIKLEVVAPTPTYSLYESIENAITKDTYMVVVTATSNVTGQAFDIERIGTLCAKKNILFLVDGAQAGGHIPIDIKTQNISMLCLATHKGLYGIMGSGALLLNDDVELSPLTFGGTGSESFNLDQPLNYPERLEAGTINLPAIMGLKAGAEYVMNNLNNISNHLYNATSQMIEQLSSIDKVKLYSTPNKSGIVSFNIGSLPSQSVADLLDSEYDVAVRGGFHCAPLTHKFLGTSEEGLVRASLAVQNTSHEISQFIKAIKRIAKG